MLVTVTEILTWQTPGSQNIKVPVAKLCMLDLYTYETQHFQEHRRGNGQSHCQIVPENQFWELHVGHDVIAFLCHCIMEYIYIYISHFITGSKSKQLTLWLAQVADEEVVFEI